MNWMPSTPASPRTSEDRFVLQMDMAKAEAARMRAEAMRDCDFGAASLARSARRLQAAWRRHIALRAGQPACAVS